MKKFKEANFVQIPREENIEADVLAKEASAAEPMNEFDGVQYVPSIDLLEVQQIEDRENWMTPIVSYLKDGKLPKGKDEARKLRVRAARYVLIDEVLYKRGFSQPYLRYLTPDEANYVLREIHERACGNHSGARSLIHKVVRAGYYWPTVQADAKAYVKVCDQCQRFSNIPRQPSEYLTPMTAPWPFAQWGLDILDLFPVGTRQMKFVVVGIDYFTKWVEAEPLASITQQNFKNFFWKNIVCRSGVPKVLVSDHGRQFHNITFKDFYTQFGIQNHYSSPAHPQANGQAEVVNRSLLKIIKTRLEGAKGVWPDELPGVLWAYRTTMKTPTGETPFKLAYRSEAVIPAEVHMANHRVMMYQEKDNAEQLRLNLDLIDEVRMDVEHRTAKYKNFMARQYDAMMKPRRFNIGDLVLKKVSLATKDPSNGKLGPSWEGPYRIINCKRQGSYYLEALDGRKLEHPWNVEHLKRYYQ